MKTIHILVLAGIGDILSHIVRFPNLEKQYPDHTLKVWLGGFGKSPKIMKEILEFETFCDKPIETSLIKNLTFHSQLPEMRNFIQSKFVKDGDLFMDWSFCEEIFSNQQPIFKQWELEDSFVYGYGSESMMNKWKPANYKNAVAIQPLTKSGNAEGFEQDIRNGRFFSLDGWKRICDLLHQDGFGIVLTGYGDEDWGLHEYCKSKGYKVYNYVGLSISDTFTLLGMCGGNISCNSWTWEVTSRLNIPTVCFYTKNHFFIKNHMPDVRSSVWDNTYLETNVNASPDEVYSIFKFMFDKNESPKVEYSVCMITMDDDKCVQDTLNNVFPHQSVNSPFVIVDGGSTDETKHLLYASESINPDTYYICENKWDDDFEKQKNYALSQATNEWRVWIDADETYESIFWNQLPWYIWLAEKNNVDCINVPRINTITGLEPQELQEYVGRQGWVLNGYFGNWVNYPDYQQRVFKSNCRFVGRTHERITGSNKSMTLFGVHCLHPKTKDRQDRGLERENKQYEIEAEKVYERVMKDEKT